MKSIRTVWGVRPRITQGAPGAPPNPKFSVLATRTGLSCPERVEAARYTRQDSEPEPGGWERHRPRRRGEPGGTSLLASGKVQVAPPSSSSTHVQRLGARCNSPAATAMAGAAGEHGHERTALPLAGPRAQGSASPPLVHPLWFLLRLRWILKRAAMEEQGRNSGKWTKKGSQFVSLSYFT